MTVTPKQILIAEHLGWKRDHPCTDHLDNPALGWRKPNGNGPWGETYLPDYFGSLDAIHEAEKTLNDDKYERFRLDLWNLVTRNERPIHNPSAPTRFERAYLSATAAQRAEAFGLTCGLWESEGAMAARAHADPPDSLENPIEGYLQCTHDETDHGICLYCSEDRDPNSPTFGFKANGL